MAVGLCMSVCMCHSALFLVADTLAIVQSLKNSWTFWNIHLFAFLQRVSRED